MAVALAAMIAAAIALAAVLTLSGGPGTRAFWDLADAWRFGDETAREAAFDRIAAAFGLDEDSLPAEERARRLTRLAEAARAFDRRHGPYLWGVRVAALLESRFPH